MGSQYMSFCYRGFLIQQNEKGWIVPQLPSWHYGPVFQGPFGTPGQAEHVIDTILEPRVS